MKSEEMIGKRFGRLSVLKIDHRKNGKAYFLCACDCGGHPVIEISQLKSGKTKSCGCLRREIAAKRTHIHGGRRTRLYKTWSNMISRCVTPTDPHYPSYGARGIRVCDEWRHDFAAFRDWALSKGYTDNLTIDRKDNDGDYKPSNCQWITRSENTQKERREQKRR